MKNLGLTAASTALLLMSSVATAQQDRETDRMVNREPARQCLSQLDRVKRQYEQAQLTDAVRNEVEQLSESARILGEAGREEACDTMVETISNMTEEARTETEDQGLQALRNAPRVTEYDGIVRASTIGGATVRNMQNEEVGTIEDTVIEARSGEISYVVLSVGGFLGVGERLVAVPWDELRFMEPDDGADPYYVVEASKGYLEKRQALGDDDWPVELEQEWQPPEADAQRD